jgi:hypothetical protein
VVRRVVAIALVVASCAAPVPSTRPDPTASFDFAAAQVFWAEECAAPTFIDPDVCEDVNPDVMRGDGNTLVVPTMLSGQNHTQFNRAQNACLALTFEGLGYELVAILDQFGAPIFTCEVDPT